MDYAPVIHHGSEPEEVLTVLLQAPVLTRRLYPRGGFEGWEPNALQVLVALHLRDEQTVGALVEQLVLGQGTVSTALALLQQGGLVRERVDSADGRRRVKRITAAGQRLVARLAVHASERVRDA